MKDLNAFIEELSKNKSLADKFKDVGDPAEVVKMAKKEGYEFTEDEYMDKQMEAVSGGIKIGNFEIDDNEWKFSMNDWIENERRATQGPIEITKFNELYR